MSDVVERLRHTADHGIFDACEKEMLPDFDEAADEIERLREALVRIYHAKQMDYSFDDLRTIAHVALKGNQ